MPGAVKRKYAGPARAIKTSKKKRYLPPMRTQLPAQLRAPYVKAVLTYSDLGRALAGSPAGAPTSYVYNLSSPYDPDVSGVGGQATGFDQYMALYEFYLVTKVTLKFHCLNTDTSASGLIGVNLSPVSGTATDPNVYMRNMVMASSVVDRRGYDHNYQKGQFSLDIGEISKKNIWNDSDFTGTVSTNPANSWYAIIWACNSDLSGTGPSTQWQVVIEYECVFRDAATTSNS